MSKESIHIAVVDREGTTHEIEVPTGIDLNIMEVCKGSDLPVEGVCGGMAMCASCHCYVLSSHLLPEKKSDEQAMLDEANDVKENSRLGCQIKITPKIDGLKIELAPDQIDDEFDEW